MNSIECNGQIFTPTKIVCVGRNYADHAKEMGASAPRSHPTIFIKPNSALASGAREIHIPESLGLLHHEVELCFVVGARCKDVSPERSREQIAGYGVGLDLTLRAMQADAKRSGAPWALAKGFDGSAPVGGFLRAEDVPDPCVLDIELCVNGEVKQHSNTSQMIFKPAGILAYVSRFMTLEEGDLFMCGTPAGVGELHDGDALKATISGLPPLEVTIKR